MMKWYFKAFWFFYLLDISSGIFKIADYVIGTKLMVLFKVSYLTAFAIILLYHLKHRVKWNAINRMFLVFGSFNLVYGLLFNTETIDMKVFSSIYTFFMPIFAVSFGIHYAEQYKTSFKSYTDKIFRYAFILSLFIVSAYLFFHYVTGQIAYFGFGSELHIIGAYFLSNRNSLVFLVSILFVIASGKRATTVNILFVGFLYYAKTFFSLRAKNLILIPVLVASMTFIFFWAYENEYLRRFEDTLAFDINDDDATYIATSGRWQEVEGIVRYLNKTPIKWIIGSGVGAKYTYVDYIYGYRRSEEKHYAHFSPIAYTFQYGLPFTLVLYYFFIYYIFSRYRKYHMNFYYLCFSVMIIGAFFGSSLFVDHKSWVLLGIISQFTRKANLDILKT